MEESQTFRESVERMYIAFRAEGLSHMGAIGEIRKLTGDRWGEAREFIPRFGMGADDPRIGCRTNEYGVPVDPFSLEEISPEKLVSFIDTDGAKYCFDIDQLLQYVESSGEAKNPFTMNKLSPYVISRLSAYNRWKKTETVVNVQFRGISTSAMLYEFEVKFIKGNPMIELVVEVYRSWAASGKAPSNDVPTLINMYAILNISDFEESNIYPSVLTIVGADSKMLDFYRGLYIALDDHSFPREYVSAAYARYDVIIGENNTLDLSFHFSGEHSFKVNFSPINASFFSIFKRLDDYFLPVKEFRGVSFEISMLKIHDIRDFVYPLDTEGESRKAKLEEFHRFIQGTLSYILDIFQDFATTDQILTIFQRVPITPDLIAYLYGKFNEQEFYDLLVEQKT